MGKTKTALDNAVRKSAVDKVKNLLIEQGEEALQVGGNILAYPVVDEEGNDSWVEISIKVPKGERIVGSDGSNTFGGYDGYEQAEFYEAEQARKAEEAKKKKALAELKKANAEAKKKKKASEPEEEEREAE